MKKIIIIGNGNVSSIEVKALLEKHDVEIVNLADSEKSEIKELADQLNRLTENENRIMKQIDTYELSMMPRFETPYIENKKGKKGYERPYKFHK